MAKRSNKFTPKALPELIGYTPSTDPRYTEKAIREALARAYTEASKAEAARKAAAIKAQNEATRRWVASVARQLTRTNIQTNSQFEKLLAQQAALLSKAAAESMDVGFRFLNAQLGADQFYQTAIERISKRGFRLLVFDVGVIKELEGLKERLAVLGGRIRRNVELIVYDALIEAFEDAWAGLTDAQFPDLYRELIYRRIEGGFKDPQWNPLQLRQLSAADWRVQVDFEKLFGDYRDLQEGYHFGALVAGNDNERVRLPYTGQRLKNPVSTRYQFWYQMWTGQRKFYRPYNATNKQDLLRKARESIPAHQKKITRLVAERNQLFEEGINDRNKKQANQRAQRIDNLTQEIERSRAILGRAQTTEGKGIRIPPDARDDTIKARVLYWNSIGSAPVWWFLEYGQLQYAPKIPPRGVFIRFQLRAQQAVTNYVIEEFNSMFSTPRGPAVSPESGFEVDFTTLTPTAKSRGFIPTPLLKSEYSAYDAARRTAAEAEAIAGKMGASDAIAQMKGRFKVSNERVNNAYNRGYAYRPRSSDFNPAHARSGAGGIVRATRAPEFYPPGTKLTKSGRPDLRYKPFSDIARKIRNAGRG